MKTRILSLAIALITLIGIGVAYAANPQWNVEPCLDGNYLKGKITGIGNGDFTLVVEGRVSCQNPGKNDPPAWQDITRTVPFSVKKNGNITFNENLRLCKTKWTPTIEYINIKIYDSNGNEITSLARNNIQSCL
jgi:hypothetical protein